MAAAKLRKGFTTGAAAAAAAKAALLSFFGRPPTSVDILFLNGETHPIKVQSIEKISGNGKDGIKATVIKDAGDDPDVTHQAKIGARVFLSVAEDLSITIRGGEGVGRITKPGLELPVGEPAINPGPRTMIRHAVMEVFSQYGIEKTQADVEIFVPDGKALAKKTLNPRLGILGGISILGTTGIVTPMSHDAYIATIEAGISVAAAGGQNTLIFTTGRRTERFAMERFIEVPPEAFIQTGDFFEASLKLAVKQPKIKAVTHVVFFAKALKMALGYGHTHAAKSELTLTRLSDWADSIAGASGPGRQIAEANTAREAFSYIYPAYPAILSQVGQRALMAAKGFSHNQLNNRMMILDFNGQIAFDSD